MTMDWKRFFNAAFDSQEAASGAKKDIVGRAADAAGFPFYLTNWESSAEKLVKVSDGAVSVPDHVTVDLPGNWQVWLADDGSHRIDEEYSELSSILGSKAEKAGLAYPLLVRSGSPCVGTAGFVAGDASSLGRALAKAFSAAAAPSAHAVLMSVGRAAPDGSLDSGITVGVVDYKNSSVSLSEDPGDGGVLESALSAASKSQKTLLGKKSWAYSFIRGGGDGTWLLVDMDPDGQGILVGNSATEPAPEEVPAPKRKGAYRFDEQGRLVDPDGNVLDEDDDLAPGFTPTLDDDGELIGEPVPLTPKPSAEKQPELEPEPEPEEHAGDDTKQAAVRASETMSPKKEAFLIKMGAIDEDGQPVTAPSPGPAPSPVPAPEPSQPVAPEAEVEPDSIADGIPKVDGAQPPADVVKSIPDWLLPMYSQGESLMCTKRGNVFEFCVFDKNDNEGWAYSIDSSTFELRLLRDPSGNPVAANEVLVRPAGSYPSDDERKAEPYANTTTTEEHQSSQSSAAPAPAVTEPAPMQGTDAPSTPLSDGGAVDVEGGESPTVEPDSQPISESDQQPEMSASVEPELESAQEQGTQSESDPEIRTPARSAYLATRPELEPVEGRTFGEFLSDLMGAKGIRPAELASVLGVSTSSVYHYCSNSKRPSFDSLKTLTEYFDCNIFRW